MNSSEGSEKSKLDFSQATEKKPNRNRARDYVHDISHWSAQAKGYLATSNFDGALLALAECRTALDKAEAYIKTGQEQYPQCEDSPEEHSKKFTPRMNIYSDTGTKVLFDNEGGYDAQRQAALGHLTLGQTYTVLKTEVSPSSTRVWFKETGKLLSFNSVQFRRVDTDDAP